jgi:hypothetical protein
VNSNFHLENLIQILDSRTAFDLNGQRLFIRHFSLKDQNLISFHYQKYEKIAISKGIETSEQIYKRLKDDGDWTEQDDLKISEMQTYVDNLKKTKSKIFLPSQKESHQKLIDEEESKLNFLLAKKSELVSMSAEDYANKRANEEFLRSLIYKDENLKNLAFSDEEFGELSVTDISDISKKYYDISKKLSDINIQKIVLQDFFNMYLSACENPYFFYGKFISDLSVFQVKLCLFGRIFYNIFQYHDDIPEDIRKEPQAIFDFVDSKKNRESFKDKYKDGGATAVFGATEKDLDILDPSARKVSLSEEIKKNGGSLNMDQMIKLMNQ